jgi:hypothetical protein
MAALSITAASVIPSTSAVILAGTVGAATTVTAGQALYLDSATNTLLLADLTTATKAAVVGISLCGGSTGQRIFYAAEDSGGLTLGCTMTVGDTIYLGDTAGTLTLTSVDLDIGEFVTIIGICSVVNSKIILKPIASGAARTTNQV